MSALSLVASAVPLIVPTITRCSIEQQRQAEEAFQRQRAAAAEEARAERQRQQRHNQRRTSYRRRELEDREAERQRQAEAELRLVEERERRLEALRAQVSTQLISPRPLHSVSLLGPSPHPVVVFACNLGG